MEVGLVRSIDIDHEMQQAYLDYAMSVIVARALPDARDGLKPVHRRILYAMYDMGLRPDTAHKKSARIVGEVLGKYHPHGDMTVYEAMARMAQDFSMRCLLVEGQGNFGSVDGDPPAAMRYTEARLANPAMYLLADIRKNTVDFVDNFDGSLGEPVVLPAALPNLLVNGATGIAVGMSTNIPPHNLGEVVDALCYMLENWEKLDDISVEDLMRFIQGPDFPTGGVIVQGEGEDDLKVAYGSGRGRVIVQARAHMEEMSRGRNRIIVTELPYLTNKSSLIERIAELAREGHLEGLADLRDESDRQGLRIVIELTKTVEPEAVLQELYKATPMRTTFGLIMLALVDGEPRMLSLKQALRVYLEHRLNVIRRRAEFDLERARQRAHILEGLRVALKHLDEVIDLIRRAPDADTARQRLMKRFKLTEIQAQAILDMQLRRLAALERKKIEDEYKEILAEIKSLQALLRSSIKMRQVVREELIRVKEAFADRRRTQIVRLGKGVKRASPILPATVMIPETRVWISATADGLVSRSLDDKTPPMSGSAAPRWSVQASTRDTLYLVSESGEAAAIPVHSLPETENPAEGLPLHKVSPLSENDRLTALFVLPPKEARSEDWFVMTATRQGMVKKTVSGELPGPAARTFTLVRVNEDDRLGWIRLTDGKATVLLATADGMAIRFSEEDIRPMGLVAAGVGGIKLQGHDEVIGMELVPAHGEILFVASDGKAKRVSADQFPVQGRYGLGVVAWKLPRIARLIGIAAGRLTSRLTLHLDELAPKAIRLDEVPTQTRTAQGKRVLEIKAGVHVVALTMPWELFPYPGAAKTRQPEVEETGETKAKRRQPALKSQAVEGRPASAPDGGSEQLVQATFAGLLQAEKPPAPSVPKQAIAIPITPPSEPAKRPSKQPAVTETTEVKPPVTERKTPSRTKTSPEKDRKAAEQKPASPEAARTRRRAAKSMTPSKTEPPSGKTAQKKSTLPKTTEAKRSAAKPETLSKAEASIRQAQKPARKKSSSQASGGKSPAGQETTLPVGQTKQASRKPTSNTATPSGKTSGSTAVIPKTTRLPARGKTSTTKTGAKKSARKKSPPTPIEPVQKPLSQVKRQIPSKPVGKSLPKTGKHSKTK